MASAISTTAFMIVAFTSEVALRLEQEKQRRSDACPASPLRQQQQQQLQQELQQLKLQQQKQQQMEQHLRSQLEAQAMTLAEHRKTVR